MGRIPRPEDLGSILRDLRIRLERLERGKAIVGGSGSGGIITSVQVGPTGAPIVGGVELDANTGLTASESGQVVTIQVQTTPGSPGDLFQLQSQGTYTQAALALGPRDFYRLNESGGTTAFDVVGTSNGTYNGTFSYREASLTGDSDFSVKGDGSTAYLTVPNSISSGSWSVVFPFKTTAVAGSLAEMQKTGAAHENDWGWQILLDGAGRLVYSFTDNRTTGGTSTLTSAGSIADGHVHLAALTYTSLTSFTAYLDGVSLGTTPWADTDGQANSFINFFADVFGTGNFLGWEDEIGLYGFALTAAQVTNLWNQIGGPGGKVPVFVDPSFAGIPSAGGTSTQVWHGDQTWRQVSEPDLSLSDVTTDNVSTAKHGFAPKAPNDATKYLDGTGAYSTPAGTGIHVHTVGEQMTGDGSTTVFYLANEAEQAGGQSTVAAYVNGSRTDVTLSADGAKVSFGTAPAAAAAIRVDYLAVLGS